MASRSGVILALLAVLVAAGPASAFLKGGPFLNSPGCPQFAFTTWVFCPPGYVNPSSECETTQVQIFLFFFLSFSCSRVSHSLGGRERERVCVCVAHLADLDRNTGLPIG